VRIAYWTTACLAPQIEAVSKEVLDLAAAFQDSRIFAVSPHLTFKLSWVDRSAGMHPRFGPLLRLVIPMIERAAHLNHIYAEVNPWLFSTALTRRPIVLTIASEKGEPIPDLLSRCAVIVTQTEAMRRRLASAGLPQNRLRLIYPGIDLSRFTPRAGWSIPARPSVLLATFPRTAQEFAGRGVDLLLEAARRFPQVDFCVVTRPWNSGGAAQRLLVEKVRDHGLGNVQVLNGLQERMEELYRRYDFTVIPYTTVDGGKECPRSLIEALACGVPILISEVAPFASFVAVHDCGRVFPCSPEGLISTLEDALSSYHVISENAVRVSREIFDLRHTLRQYGAIYDELG